jgi:hypothetical protein
MIAGPRAFPDGVSSLVIVKKVVLDESRPAIPEWLAPGVRALITDCWADDPDDRPSFEEICERLQKMDFKSIDGVNSGKVSRFVKEVKALEGICDEEGAE